MTVPGQIVVGDSHEVPWLIRGTPLSVSTPPPPAVNSLEGLTDVAGIDTAVAGNVLTLGSDGVWRPAAPISPSDIEFQFTQSMPASVWQIDHNLGRHPASVSMFSADFSVNYFGFVVQHLSVNSLRLSMDIPTAGIAFLI